MIVQHFHAWLPLIKLLQVIGKEAISPVSSENLITQPAAGSKVWTENKVTELISSRNTGFDRQRNFFWPFLSFLLFVLILIIVNLFFVCAVVTVQMSWFNLLRDHEG